MLTQKIQAFWTWFSAEQDEYYRLEESEHEKLFHALSEQLKKLDENLTFEFSAIKEDGKREFVISANGMLKTFPVVFQMHEAAPDLKKWEIIALKPRMNMPNLELGINGKRFGMDDVFFQWKKYDKELALQLFFRGNLPDQLRMQVGFIFLDTLLGEYDVATKIGHIDFLPLNESEVEQLISIVQLPQIIDRELPE